MRAYRFRLYPSKKQEEILKHHLWVKKELWNALLQKTKERYVETQTFLTLNEMANIVKCTELYSQSAQSVFRDLDKSLKAKVRAKKKGQKWGFPRFKSFDRVRSIHYPQFGFSLDKKLKVSPFGEIPIVRHREITGKIKTLTLKRESSDKWYAIFSVEHKPSIPKSNHGPSVGLDLGLSRLATLSDGNIIKNPNHFYKFEEQLAQAQRNLSKKRKGSHNCYKAKRRVILVHEAIANARKDHLHKKANWLLSNYSKIAMEDLRINKMIEEGHGKGIHDASWGIFTNILCYKAESAGSEIVFVNPKDTTKECSNCHSIIQKSLWERIHSCSSCGLVLDRDVNAAINILTRATAGMAGSNACGDGIEIPSLKQEAHVFRYG